MPLFIVEKLIDGTMVLDLRGRITLGEETEALRQRVKRLLESGRLRVIVDLAEVTYIDSVGLSTLIACFTSIRKAGGDLKLLHLTKRVRGLLQITRLSTVFEVYDTLEEARQSFERPSA